MAVEIPVIIDIEQAFQNAAKQVNSASAPLKSSIEALNDRIKEDFELLNMSKVSDPVWKQAAKDIQIASQALEVFNDHVAKYTTNEGSIKRLNAELASVSRRWAEMGAQQKFTATGELTADAQKLVSDYRDITKEIQKQGKSLEQIIAEEQRIEALKQKGIQTRRYENAILKATGNTIRVLEEKERILSSRLSTAKIGSSKYRQLKTDLEAVRVELDKVNGRVAQATIPALEKAGSRLGMLVKRSIELVALHSAARFIHNIREVTAEFELQKVALGSIIQDTEKANVLFKQIKAAAIQSPFQIKDLVTYTKQLSAYRVETENLFGVTMKLADVSAGLGVDMNRLILAYGQVKAASVLRGQELRQFSEAGIPLVAKLAEKFSELRGTMVTTSEVFELISKRAVPFEMIADIFDDMTERGGEFYKMQEKQAETLAGQWSNLKDSLSIMYDEMGNTGAVHDAMVALIQDAKVIFQSWHLIANAVKFAAVQFGLFKIAGLWLPNLRRELGLAKRAQDAYNRSLELSKYTAESGSKAASREAARLRVYSMYMRQASAETNLFKRAYLQLKAVMAGTSWISAIVAVLSALATVLVSATIESGRLNKELRKIGAEGDANISRSIANFERLANQAVNAADGSKEQAKALEELKRTYGDLIPSQQLEIEALRSLKGNYDSVTRAIREKISEQIREQQVNTITDNYSKKITRKQKKAKDYLAAYGLDRDQISVVLEEIQKEIERGTLSIESTLIDRREAFEKIIKDLTGIAIDFSKGGILSGESRSIYTMGEEEVALNDLLDVYLKMDTAINDVDNSMKRSIGTYGKFANMAKDLEEAIGDIFVDEKQFGKPGTFSNNQEKIRQSVEIYWDYIEKAFNEVNAKRKGKPIDISAALLGGDKIDFDFINEAVKDAMAGGQNTRLDAYIKDIKEKYEQLIPSDKLTSFVRVKVTEIAEQYGVAMDIAQQYFKKAETSMTDYVKSLQQAATEHRDALQFMNNASAGFTDEEKETEKATNLLINALLKFFGAMSQAGGGGKTSYVQDPFIAQMQERMKFMQDFKKGYDDFNKYISKSDALAEQAKIMRERGLALGIDPSEQAKAAENLSEWYKAAIDKAFAQAKTHGATGTVESFLSQQISDTSKNGKALKDFQKLIQSLWDARTDIDTSKKKKEFEDALKRLSEEIKQTETARNFYQDILDLTGDEQLAATLGVSIYSNIGQDFKDRLQQQLNEAMKTLDASALTDEMQAAFANQDFGTILANLDKFPPEWRSRLKEMATDSQKFNADRVKDLLKALQRSKTYADQQVALAKQTAQRTAQIQSLTGIDEATRERLLKGNARKEAEESAKIAYEAFKDTPMYVEMFSDLDAASLRMLTNMRKSIGQMKDSWKGLSAQELKELQSRMNELDEQIARKNPFKALAESLKEYRALQQQKSRKDAEDEAIAADEKLEAEEKLLQTYRQEYLDASALGEAGKEQADAAKEKMEAQAKVVDKAKEEADAAQKSANAYKQAAKDIRDAAESMQDWASSVTEALGGIEQIVGTFGSSDLSDTFGILSEGVGKAMSGAASAALGVGQLLKGDPRGIATAIKGIGDFISGTFGTASKLKVKSLDKQIEKQTDLIDDLGSSYDRLENAMSKAFGSDYIYNYNQQLEVLKAQADAYQKQADLERKKGKKADEDTAKGYEKSAQEVLDQIEEMQGKLSEFFSGTDLTSAARDFAQAWIEAYKEFGSTTTAMQEKFNDMIENMVVNSLAAKLIQGFLKPIFGQIEAATQEGDLTAAKIGEITAGVPAVLQQIDAGMGTLMSQLTTAGINLRTQAGQFTGVSRDIAGASEESILGLSAGVNTANFYMSHLPAIAENVAALRAYIVGDSAETVRTTASEGPTYEDQMLGYAANLPLMRDDMYAVRSLLEKVIKPVGSTYAVSVR